MHLLCNIHEAHLRDNLAAELTAAGVGVRTEVQLPGSGSRPADIADPANATPTAIDVSVVHPLQLSASSAEDTPGAFAAAREQAKRSSSTADCAAAGWAFMPVCAETTGAWGPQAQKHIRKIIFRHSMRAGIPLSDVASATWRRLSVAVAKGVACMLLRAYPGTFGNFVTSGAALHALGLRRLPGQNQPISLDL